MTQWSDLPEHDSSRRSPATDWLIDPSPFVAGVFRGAADGEIVLTNGLLLRRFRLAPNAATVDFDNLMLGTSVICGTVPEAVVSLDGTRYDVGGSADENTFQLVSFEVGPIRERLAWKRVRYCSDQPWPPPGVELIFHYASASSPKLTLSVHYELYDGIPLLSKWFTLANHSADAGVRLNWFVCEQLATTENASTATGPPMLHIDTDHVCCALRGRGIFWDNDTEHAPRQSVGSDGTHRLEVRPPAGPELEVAPGETFESFRCFELLHDGGDRERTTLSVRKMYRTLAPWSTENPILMHVCSAEPEHVKLAIDQCAEVGFEMVVITFGSSFDVERVDEPGYVEEIRELVDYAHSKGVEIGGYSLLASRSIGPDDDVVNPKTGELGGFAFFDHSPCLGSRWGLDYFRKLHEFYERTGMDLLEHDGSYAGDCCASTVHPGHRDYDDSQWRQWKMITDFYKWCRARGIYLNVPDWYPLTGSNKAPMGYDENTWSLPRERQILIGRQNVYDGTWSKTPSMGWMFTPLVQYHGGGEAATIEPLCEHLDAYEAHLSQNFGAGVQSCYRGHRLYDTDETKAIVVKWVDFYKRYRAILDSDIIHVRRADGRHLDCILHANPTLELKGLAMVYNPLPQAVTETLRLPLYYTGLTDTARIAERDGAPRSYPLARDYSVEIEINLAPSGCTWLLIS